MNLLAIDPGKTNVKSVFCNGSSEPEFSVAETPPLKDIEALRSLVADGLARTRRGNPHGIDRSSVAVILTHPLPVDSQRRLVARDGWEVFHRRTAGEIEELLRADDWRHVKVVHDGTAQGVYARTQASNSSSVFGTLALGTSLAFSMATLNGALDPFAKLTSTFSHLPIVQETGSRCDHCRDSCLGNAYKAAKKIAPENSSMRFAKICALAIEIAARLPLTELLVTGGVVADRIFWRAIRQNLTNKIAKGRMKIARVRRVTRPAYSGALGALAVLRNQLATQQQEEPALSVSRMESAPKIGPEVAFSRDHLLTLPVQSTSWISDPDSEFAESDEVCETSTVAREYRPTQVDALFKAISSVRRPTERVVRISDEGARTNSTRRIDVELEVEGGTRIASLFERWSCGMPRSITGPLPASFESD